MIDKEKIDNLLFAYRTKKYWLKLFSKEADDPTRVVGPKRASYNRREKMADEAYSLAYWDASSEETELFHSITNKEIAREVESSGRRTNE